MNLGHENETLEFKESLGQLDKGLKSITAMLNRSGYGCVCFGVLDNGDVKGLTVGPNTCLLYTSPSPRDLSTSRMPSSA